MPVTGWRARAAQPAAHQQDGRRHHSGPEGEPQGELRDGGAEVQLCNPAAFREPHQAGVGAEGGKRSEGESDEQQRRRCVHLDAEGGVVAGRDEQGRKADAGGDGEYEHQRHEQQERPAERAQPQPAAWGEKGGVAEDNRPAAVDGGGGERAHSGLTSRVATASQGGSARTSWRPPGPRGRMWSLPSSRPISRPNRKRPAGRGTSTSRFIARP